MPLLGSRIGLAFLCMLFLVVNSFAQKSKSLPKDVSVVLMIGDGMGLAQVSSASWSSKKALAIEKFPVVGFHKPYASDDLITDSAAGATAFACGVRTFKRALGMNRDTLPCKTLLSA